MTITPLLDTLRLQKIDDEEYFSEKYSNYISNSRLGLINPDQGGSPERFFTGFKPMYSAAFDLGRRYDIKLSEIMNMIKKFIAVPIEESSELLQTKIGEGCDANPEVITETKESVTP